MKSGIYCIENLVNGKKYIGQSLYVKKRMNDAHKDCKYLARALKKYGEKNFIRYAVEYCSFEELIEKEKWYIRNWNTKIPNGYNLTDGGEGSPGCVPNIKTRRLLSISHLGIKRSEETKKKMADSKKGKNNPAYGKKGKDSVSFGTKHPNASSRFLGIHKNTYFYKDIAYVYWEAGFNENKKRKRIGLFKTEDEAARAYDKYILENKLDRPINFKE
jgi:group I intron endonuclease